MINSQNLCFMFRCISTRLKIPLRRIKCMYLGGGDSMLLGRHLPHRNYFSSPCNLRPVENSKDELHIFDMDEFEMEDDSPKIINIDQITGGSPEKLREFKLLELEVEVLRQQGGHVPLNLNTAQWIELMNNIPGKMARIKYLRYLWLIQTKRANRKEKQRIHQKELVESKKSKEELKNLKLTTSSPPVYALQFNSLFHRIYDNQIHRFLNYRLMLAEMYQPVLLIDCSYEPYMSQKNLCNCIKQLMFTWSENRNHFNPFHLIFCNLNEDSRIFKKLKGSIPGVGDPNFPFYYTSKNYLDLYPKNKLVYLSPHAHSDFTEYNPDDIYIVGAFVDQSQTEPVSLAKGKKENLRLAKFPIDRHLKWVQGTKSLTIIHAVAIMNDIKARNDWSYAFRHIPSRKVLKRDILEGDPTEVKSAITSVKEQFRRNLVYDLLLKENMKKDKTENSENRDS